MAPTSPHWHVGLVVQDIHAAMDELSAALDMHWVPPQVSTYDPWEITVTFSIEGPPHIELIQGGPGGPWDASEGPRFDHLGYWSEDVAADSAHLASVGVPLELDSGSLGKPSLFCYHRSAATGTRIEVLQRSDALMNLVKNTLKPSDGGRG